MPDNMTKDQRSRTMSKIHSKWTKQETLIHQTINKFGVPHIMHPKIPGSPDFIIPSQKIAVFIHGCFWHKCPLCFRTPKSNEEYWFPKLDKNIKRDAENENVLRNSGWEVSIIWEHEIKKCPIDELQDLLKSKGIILENKGEIEK